MHLLVTNDDGVHAPALEALRRALAPLGRVTIVVPDRDQSATSHALTLHRPLRIHDHGDDRYSVDGTPTDCVLIAYHGLLDHAPDLVVSGINHGPNMGEDVFYSGTVAAAIEGAMQGAPAIAASLATHDPVADFDAPAGFVARLVAAVAARGLQGKQVLNVNLPHRAWSDVRGVRITRLGTRVYSDTLVRKTDPRGRAYYWIGGQEPVWAARPGSDVHAVESGHVSVTPLALDLTDGAAVDDLAAWALEP